MQIAPVLQSYFRHMIDGFAVLFIFKNVKSLFLIELTLTTFITEIGNSIFVKTTF